MGGNTRVSAQDPPPIDIFVQEQIGVSDSDETTVPATVDVDDMVHVEDDVSVIGPVVIEISESIGISDGISIVGPAIINVFEQVTVTDTGGLINSAPIVDAGIDSTVDEGITLDLDASVIVLDPQLTTATINWGDGSTYDQVVPTAVGAIVASHLYDNDGVFTVTVTVAGLFGDQGVDTTQITVTNLPPIVDIGGPYTLDAADTSSTAVLTAIASDPGQDRLIYAWDLDEDGDFDDSTNQTVVFQSPTVGEFLLSVEVTDDSGATATDSAIVTVIDTTAGIALPDENPQEVAGADTAVLRLRSFNTTANTVLREGQRLVVNATLLLDPGVNPSSVGAIEFLLDGHPLPVDALVVRMSATTSRVQFGRNTIVAGETLVISSTAYDLAGSAIAISTLSLAVASNFTFEFSADRSTVNVGDPVTFTALGQSSKSRVTYSFYELEDDTSTQRLLAPASSASTLTVRDFQPGIHKVMARADDESGGVARSTLVTVTVLDPSQSRSEQTGRVSGRSVIGRLISLTTEAVVVGTDLGHVQVHIDSNATEMAADIGAEAFSTGSKVVVIADREILSGNAIALKIVAIPGTATRRHGRVLVSDSGDGNTAVLVSADDSDGTSRIKDDAGLYSAGDQLIVLVFRDGTSRGSDDPTVLGKVDDINDRLNNYADRKFSDGDNDASGLIDRLAEKQRELEQQRIDEASKHADEAVRRAAELAAEKARRAAENDAADPVKVIRKQAVADSEDAIIACASRTVGRTVSGEGDLNDDEMRRVKAACLGGDSDGGSGRMPEASDGAQSNTAPPEVLDCIIRVLGSVPNRAITDEEEVRLQAACSLGDRNNDDGKTTEEKKQERNTDSALDDRKVAFCEANPSDSHCSGVSAGSSGGKGDTSAGEKEKRAFCADNPRDSRCANVGVNTVDDSGKVEPETKNDPGTKPPGK